MLATLELQLHCQACGLDFTLAALRDMGGVQSFKGFTTQCPECRSPIHSHGPSDIVPGTAKFRMLVLETPEPVDSAAAKHERR